jgi:hypothetical protein
MSPERNFWRLIRDHLPGHKERVENAAVSGFPDVNGCSKGAEYWVELKAPNVRTVTPDDVDRVEKLLEDTQYVWHNRRVRQGGRVFVAIKYATAVALFRAVRASGVAHKYRHIVSLSSPYAWDVFESCFSKELIA